MGEMMVMVMVVFWGSVGDGMDGMGGRSFECLYAGVFGTF